MEKPGDADATSSQASVPAGAPSSSDVAKGLGALMFDREAQDALNAARSADDLRPELRAELEAYRSSEPYRRIYEQEAPLVSVCICTYNRARLLSERCLPSVLAQDYPNFEIIVAGDGCTDGTEDALLRLGDSRVKFVNLPRGEYPKHLFLRWLVAGTIPTNHARAIAAGDLMTHIDDDDEYSPGRLTKLVRFLQEQRAELVWHPFWYEQDAGKWAEWGAPEFRAGHVTAGSVLYLSWLKRIECDPKAYRYLEPADWNLYRKIRDVGTKLARYPEPLLRHHRERTQK